MALAQAGFVAAAITHAGDSYEDQSRVVELWRRPEQLARLISHMLEHWHARDRIDASRVGAFGFSNGGFTTLVMAGGVPNLSTIERYCNDNPMHDLCTALERARIDMRFGRSIGPGRWVRDGRIRAAAIAAPAFGFAFDEAGLQAVRIPLQLWGAADDRHQPSPHYEDVVRANLPREPEFHRVDNAGHYDFLPPCGPSLAKAAPDICTSAPGFDRSDFHERFNAAVVAFFRRTLK
jgi:predicted dienelactone hydrolase